MKINHFKQKKKKLLTKEQQESYENAKICYICKEKFQKKYFKKIYSKVRDHCHHTGEHRGTAHSICNLKYNVPKKIPIVFYNRSNYGYHFVLKKLAKEFKKQFSFLGENTEKYINLSSSDRKLKELIKIKIEKKFQKLYRHITIY